MYILDKLVGLLKECYRNDIRRIRYFTRPLKYKKEQFEFYRLADVRAEMFKHKYVDKQQVIKEKEQNQNEEWKWVFHIKPQTQQKYGRFWSRK